MKTPLYLRDLNKELQAVYLPDVLANPKTKKAYENNEDIEIGSIYFYQKPRPA